MKILAVSFSKMEMTMHQKTPYFFENNPIINFEEDCQMHPRFTKHIVPYFLYLNHGTSLDFNCLLGSCLNYNGEKNINHWIYCRFFTHLCLLNLLHRNMASLVPRLERKKDLRSIYARHFTKKYCPVLEGVFDKGLSKGPP